MRNTEEFSNNISLNLGEEVGHIIDRIFSYCKEGNFKIRRSGGSIFVGFEDNNGKLIEPLSFSSSGKLWGMLAPQYLKTAFEADEQRTELRRRLAETPGLRLTSAQQYPSAPLKDVTEETPKGLMNFLEWARDHARTQPSPIADNSAAGGV